MCVGEMCVCIPNIYCVFESIYGTKQYQTKHTEAGVA